jgi:aryl-alcohol dehydrogenase-like predicted oxidoreductase
VPFSPLGKGFLTGKIDDLRQIEESRAHIKVQGDRYPAHLAARTGR